MSGKRLPNFLTKILDELDLSNELFLVNDQKVFAYCLGIRKPKIYISTELVKKMTRKELKAILLHEKYHLENKDPLIMLFVTTVQHLFPFFPFISDLIRNYRIDREILADKEAIKLLGAAPLISTLKKLLNLEAASFAFTVGVSELDTLEPRIRALVRKDRRFQKYQPVNIVVSLFSLFIIAGFLLVPVRAEELTVCLNSHVPNASIPASTR